MPNQKHPSTITLAWSKRLPLDWQGPIAILDLAEPGIPKVYNPLVDDEFNGWGPPVGEFISPTNLQRRIAAGGVLVAPLDIQAPASLVWQPPTEGRWVDRSSADGEPLNVDVDAPPVTVADVEPESYSYWRTRLWEAIKEHRFAESPNLVQINEILDGLIEDPRLTTEVPQVDKDLDITETIENLKTRCYHAAGAVLEYMTPLVEERNGQPLQVTDDEYNNVMLPLISGLICSKMLDSDVVEQAPLNPDDAVAASPPNPVEEPWKTQLHKAIGRYAGFGDVPGPGDLKTWLHIKGLIDDLVLDPRLTKEVPQ